MLLVSSSNDIKFHSASNYDTVQVYRPNDCSGLIKSVSWCRDGTLLSTIPFKGNAEILRTKDDVRMIQSINEVCLPSTVAFQRTTKKNIALGTTLGSVLVYDIKTRSTKKVFSKTGNPITMLDWNHKDTHLAALNSDGEIYLYNNLNNQKTGVIKLQNGRIASLRFHQNHKSLLAYATNEGNVAVWDNNVGKNKFFTLTHKAPVTDIVFSSQNNTLLTSVALDRTFQCYDANEGETVLTVSTDQPLSAIDMANNGVIIAVASIRGNIYMYDLRHYQNPFKTIQAHEGEITRIFYQPQDTTESIQIPEDKITETEVVRQSSVDSFSRFVTSGNEFSPSVDYTDSRNVLKRTFESLDDSFLNDMSPTRYAAESYEKSNEYSNLKITEGVKKWIDSKSNLLDSSLPHGSCVDVQKEPSAPFTTNNTSTPTEKARSLCFVAEPTMHDSPIVTSNTNVNIEDIRKIVKEVVTEVAAEQMVDLMDSLSRYFLNLQLSFSKQFVNQETALEKLLNSQPHHNNCQTQIDILKEENEFLKKKLNDMWKEDKN